MRRLWLAAALTVAACADEIPEDVSTEMERAARASHADSGAEAGPSVNELMVSAPPGGHVDWIRDIRAGLDSVPAEAALDRGEALYTVQELYSRRYVPLRQFYGPDGAAPGAPRLASAVEGAGTRLQELMGLLAGNQSDAGAVEQAVRAVQDALDQAQAAAQAAGLHPSAPRDSAVDATAPAVRDTAAAR